MSAFASECSNEISEAQDSPLSQEESAVLSRLHHSLSNLHREGQITIQEGSFWHQAGSHWRMPKAAPQLFEAFKQSELVIFKGDLHYRKLTADVSLQYPLLLNKLHDRFSHLFLLTISDKCRPCGQLQRLLRIHLAR